jgi:predicted RNase H-like nuclease (RuvC/YqgF family)
MQSKLFDEIKEYCAVNSFDYSEVLDRILTTGFNIEKYGDKPQTIQINKEQPKKVEIIEKEIMVEKEVIIEDGEIINRLKKENNELKSRLNECEEEKKELKKNKRDLYGE